MRYTLGIDFGGGAAKATLLCADGQIAATHTVEYPTAHPTARACEQNPADWWNALCTCTREVLRKGNIQAGEIAAVALDSATHSAVVCDGNMIPLRPCIHWTDSRSAEQAAGLRQMHGAEIFAKTYHSPDTVWTLPQLLWLRETEPQIYEKIRYVLFEKDWLRYCLTGILCTDRIEAAGSMLYNCERGEWDADLCALAGLTAGQLPPLCAPTDSAGAVTATAAAKTGLAEGTPVICGTTDTCMEILASGAIREGDMTVKLATAGRICVITDHACPDRQLVCYPHAVCGLWYPGTATKAAASALRWYRDTFGDSYREIDAAAETVSVGCEGLMFHPYLNGELTPYADPALCGSFVGVRSTHTKAHFDRAVLEGVALSLLDCYRYLEMLGIPHGNTATLIGGGAGSPLWGQIVSDCLGLTLTVTENSDSSLGSAMLAGVAVGLFDGYDQAVAHCVRTVRTLTPNEENTKRYAELYKTYRRVHDALAPIYSGGET